MNPIPGKLFILGEYSVMHGGEAILATLKPGYRVKLQSGPTAHPDSPAGKFLIENPKAKSVLIEGGWGPGFGTSTAELIAMNATLDQPWTLEKLWKWYRRNFHPASGADLAVQYRSFLEPRSDSQESYFRFRIQDDSCSLEAVRPSEKFTKNTLIFRASASVKILTHTHLSLNEGMGVDQEFSRNLIQEWLETQNPEILTRWSEYLSRLGYESDYSSEVRNAFQKIPGVLGVKGCGAGLNDSFLVSIDPENSKPDPVSLLDSVGKVVEKFNLTSLGTLGELTLS